MATLQTTSSKHPLCNLYPEDHTITVDMPYRQIGGGLNSSYAQGGAGQINNQLLINEAYKSATNFGNITVPVGGEMALKFPDGSEYRGNLRNNKPHGQGTYIRPDRTYHNGEWYNGLPQGYGVEAYPNGDVYKGLFQLGQREGEIGEYISPRFKYAGTWVEGMMSGRGKLNFVGSNQKYTGEFQRNKFHGFGLYTYPSGVTYEGFFVDGLKHGRGKLILPDGSFYLGDWERGQPTDKAVFNDKNGNSVIGYWQNGNFVPKSS